MTTHNGHIQPATDGAAEYVDGQLAAVPAEDEGVFLTEIASRYGVSMENAMSLYGDIEEHIRACLPAMQKSKTTQSAIELLFRRGACMCAAARTPQRQAFLFQCLMIVLGWAEDLGVKNPTDLARRFKMTKANANRDIVILRDALASGMAVSPASNGQRDEEIRRKFCQIRYQQESKRKSCEHQTCIH